jgi:hypothetical protein
VVIAAKHLLPQTGLIHGGRAIGNPDSHYWFKCEEAETHAFTDVKDAKNKSQTLVEIRSTGGYTVVPPSIWTDKDDAWHTEPIAWSIERDPLPISSKRCGVRWRVSQR